MKDSCSLPPRTNDPCDLVREEALSSTLRDLEFSVRLLFVLRFSAGFYTSAETKGNADPVRHSLKRDEEFRRYRWQLS